MVPLPDSTDTDTNKTSTLIGWGKGKGNFINFSGWEWGGLITNDVSKAKRWGTNVSASSADPISFLGYSYSYPALKFVFNATGSEATAAMSDSGGGVFQQFGTTWKLSGILTVAPYESTYPNGASLYNPSYQTYAVQLKPLASKFRYRQWKQEKGIAEATLPGNDTDADGIGILEEYAFGLDPAAATTAGRPSVGTEGTDLTLPYQLERTRTDLTVGVEETTDLITWTPATVSSTTTVSDSGSIRTYKAKVPISGAEKKFLRLKLTALTN
ncbi:MAG: hypothetical protein ACOYM3_00880 [Terrimicrobiaceae bacterium]